MRDLRVKSVPALTRALKILERLATSRRGISLSEFSEELRIPKSSAIGILATLERAGYITRNESTRCYSIGIQFLALAKSSLPNIELRHKSAPLLHSLAEKSQMTVNMAILEDNEAIFIEKITPPGQHSPPTWIGKHIDVNCTAVGKVLLAYLPHERAEQYLLPHGLPRHNDNGAESPRKFQEELQNVRKLGYAFNDEENDVGYRAIAVPVLVDDGKFATAAICVAGRINQIRQDNFASLLGLLQSTAARISQQHPPPYLGS